jgi:excisionase family DNA binding protein
MSATERWVSVSDVARELGVSARTVERWCAHGKVPTAPRVDGSPWRIQAEWVREHKRKEAEIYAAIRPVRR